MKAVIKYTFRRGGDFPDEIGEDTYEDTDPKYMAWVDNYNAGRRAKMSDTDVNCCKSLDLPVAYGYRNPFMMLLYLSPGNGVHYAIDLIIHSVTVTA